MVSKSKKKPKVPAHDTAGSAGPDTAAPSDIPAEQSIDQLIRELKNPSELVRSAAAGELGHRKSEIAVKPLIAALKDPHPWVRHGAAWALGEIKSEAATDALSLALKDPDEITRGKAAEALVKIRGF
nr:HEAT repeat domain-containing protein [uncultured Methanoregula sp.]